jgi:hypothetical protein
MHRLAIFCGLLGLVLGSPVRGADDLVMRSTLTPEDPWIGQRVILQIDVLAPNAWAQLEATPRFDIAGAYVLPPLDQGVRLQEMINGVSHTGQRYEFSLYPQREGTLELSEAPLRVRVRELRFRGKETSDTLTLPAMTLSSRRPPGLEPGQAVVSAQEVDIQQQWESSDSISVGDAITREVRFTANGISGMAFVPIPRVNIDGLGTYPTEPRVEDQIQRGTIVGSRTERVTYIAEKAGAFALPALRFTWWDIDDEELREVELPGIAFDVSPATLDSTSESRIHKGWATQQMLYTLFAAAIALALTVFLSRLVINRWQKYRLSEHYQFRELQWTITAGSPRKALRELMGWLDRIHQTGKPATLEAFLDKYADEGTKKAVTALQDAVNADHKHIDDAAVLKRGLTRARLQWRKHQTRTESAMLVLPPLNQ